MTDSPTRLSRRGLVATGAALVAGGSVSASSSAQAAGPSSLDGPPQSQASPITSTIASPRRDFLVYRTLGEFDFTAEDAEAKRKFGTKGVYASAQASSMWATVDVPNGVILEDVEFYAFNNSGVNARAVVWLWSASDGFLSKELASVVIPSTNSLIAARAEFSPKNYGPFPTGTKIFLTLFTTADTKLQINGARLGMRGGGNVSLSPAPIRVFDSRKTSKFDAGEMRTITVPVSAAQPGTVGLFTQITVLQASSAGYVQIYPANLPPPTTGGLYHQAATTSSYTPTVALPVSRKLKITATKAAHVILDVAGTIS